MTTSVFICTTCKAEGDAEPRGTALFEAVIGQLRQSPAEELVITPIECLAVCKRPCTVALSATGKWTYIVGDLAPDLHAEDVVAAARAYDTSRDGIVPWRERPVCFRRGIVARIPPVTSP
jgi:predicted metal-binding protein